MENISLPAGVCGILSVLENAGFAAYVAGGAVRDILLGRDPGDYDIATAAAPQQVKSLFARVIDTGIRHGTVTVIENKLGYEITTFRRESGYSDHRRPDSVEFAAAIEEDLPRRDFTVNAMAYSPKRGLVDIFGGREDLDAHIIRAVGDPAKRFREDALRMLRCVRFCASLDFNPDPNTLAAIGECAPLIRDISGERVLGELNKLLLSPHPEKLMLLWESGLMEYMLPPLARCFTTPQRNKYHIYNVGEHIVHVVAAAPNDLVLRWAALLHDIGKPVCSSTDSSGVIHFYGHHKESVNISKDLLHRLRMDSAMISDILTLVEYHDVHLDSSPQSVKRMLSRMGEDLFLKLLRLQEADNRAKNPKYLDEKLFRIENTRRIYNRIISEGQPYLLSHLAVNGRDLIKCGYHIGRQIGDTLRTLLDEVIINPGLNNRTYLIKRARELLRTPHGR